MTKFKTLMAGLALAASSIAVASHAAPPAHNIAPGTASGIQASFEGVPTTWLLQDYVGVVVVVWNTGAPAPCGQQQQNFWFSSSTTPDEINRFWALVLTARTAGTKAGLWYDTGSCQISSFYTPID